MNISYAKFFQPVDLVKSKQNNAGELTTYARERDYNMTIDGNFLKVQSKDGGKITLVTIFNVAYLRTDNEVIDTSAETSRKSPSKAKAE